jgi:hypothetical protein
LVALGIAWEALKILATDSHPQGFWLNSIPRVWGRLFKSSLDGACSHVDIISFPGQFQQPSLTVVTKGLLLLAAI